MTAKPAYADIAIRVANIAKTNGSQVAGAYLEDIMEEEFEKIRAAMQTYYKIITTNQESIATNQATNQAASEKRIKDHFDVSIERLKELAGNSPNK